MPLHRKIRKLQAELSMVDDLFAEHAATYCELDTDHIETLLIGWEDFLDVLRDAELDDPGGLATETADYLFDKIEAVQEQLAQYEDNRAAYEEAQADAEMTTRLQQCTDEHELVRAMKAKYALPDIGREHVAEHRLKDTPNQTTPSTKRHTLRSSRLAIEE